MRMLFAANYPESVHIYDRALSDAALGGSWACPD
jgi:hypothetical protein